MPSRAKAPTTAAVRGKPRAAVAPAGKRSAPAKPTERIAVENVNVPGRTTMVDAAKYAAMRKALLKVVPRKAPGVTQAEMAEGVVAHLPEALFPGGEKAMWWAKCVQLDLEAKRVLTRDDGKPLRWRRLA